MGGRTCPNCDAHIKPYDNVPVLSWLWLRGRCRACREPISARYPLVELANALFYLAIVQRTGPSIGFLPIAAIVSMILALIYIDAEIQILPDVIDLPGIVIGLGMGAAQLGGLYPDLVLSTSLTDSILGAAGGGGCLLLIALTYKLVRRIEGMGLGDVKLMAMFGAVMGWEPLFLILMLASVTGAVVGVIAMTRSGKGMTDVALPFGVFLGIAALAMLFFGQSVMSLLLPLLSY